MKNPFLPLRIKSLLASVCLLALSISMSSCDEEEPPRISLSSTEARFGFEAATQPLRVETGFAWSTRIVPAEAAEWCRLSLEGSILTNGRKHYCCEYRGGRYVQLAGFPDFAAL